MTPRVRTDGAAPFNTRETHHPFYGVETRRLIEQVRRNAARFPGDFVFQLTRQEVEVLRSQNVISGDGRAALRSQNAILKRGQHIKFPPYVFDLGVIDAQSMRGFDALRLPPLKANRPADIKRLRLKARTSQAVFAAYLNTSVSTAQKWEIGEKKPGGPALKLLNIVKRKGLIKRLFSALLRGPSVVTGVKAPPPIPSQETA